MCFVPQRRALFQHLNFHKCSGAEVSLTFWLRNMLRATTACNYFWSLISPDGSAPAALASLLFDPPELQNIGKTKFRDFSTVPFCAPSSSFFWLFLFSDLFFPFFLWLLSCPYCQSLISKFPRLYTRTHTHTYTHTYIYIYIYLMLAHYMYCVFFPSLVLFVHNDCWIASPIVPSPSMVATTLLSSDRWGCQHAIHQQCHGSPRPICHHRCGRHGGNHR